MSYTQKNSGIFQLIGTAISTLLSNRIMLFPFAITAFIQILVLELLYFYPRFPLNVFFGPIIKKLWAEDYLHFPMNFILLPKLFQYAQIPIFVFFSSFLIAVSLAMLVKINNDQTFNVRQLFREQLRQSYIHIFVAAVLSVVVMFIFYKIFGWIYLKATFIKAQSGIYYWIKMLVIGASPAISMLMGVLVTTLFVHVFPVIVIEKKKFLEALAVNFVYLFRYPWRTFLIVFIPSIFFVPIMLIRNFVSLDTLYPELSVLILLLTVFFMITIDVIVYTTITVHILTEKER